jgi:hypothetical protein
VSFADKYIERYSTARIKDLGDPDPGLFIIVVIPAYNEPDLERSILSLMEAEPPGCQWEIIIVVNEPENCPEAHHIQNLESVRLVNQISKSLTRNDLRIHYLYPEPFKLKKAGPGYARKIGMDEAIRRFSELNKPDGVIVSFDSDTLCSNGYLRDLGTFYKAHPEAGGCTVYFEHPLENENFIGPVHRNGMIEYELYLRYFRHSLEWMGFPYVSYSLGSAFSIRALRYARAGGMGLQQAGEDFYFLQKCIPMGEFWELNNITVYPSVRISDRVVFGTGPRLSMYIKDGGKPLPVYQIDLFKNLRPLFTYINNIKALPSSLKEIEKFVNDTGEGILKVLIELNWLTKIRIALDESAGIESFKKRFYHEINLLQIIRLFNELEARGFPKRPVAEEFRALWLLLTGHDSHDDLYGLLLQARGLDRGRGTFRIT